MKALNNESNQKDTITNKNPPFNFKETATNDFVQLLSNSRNECTRQLRTNRTHFANAKYLRNANENLITINYRVGSDPESNLGLQW